MITSEVNISEDIKELVGTVTLLNEHTVFETTTKYFIESPIGENGQIIKREYPKNRVNIIRNLLRRKELSVDQAVKRIEKSPHNNLLNYRYEPKKNNEVQDILICLVAVGKSNCSIEGARFIFKIL